MKAGDTIGSFEILGPIAAGGMGVVYRARHRVLRREHAVKVLLANLALSEPVVARFQQEAYVQAQLAHPHIVQVQDFVADGGTLAIVMELIDGPSLAQVLAGERAGPWPLSDVQAVMGPVLDALAFAHGRGVVHRDVKPGNVLLDRSGGAPWPGTPKVTDFGLAKLLASEAGMTRTGTRMGTFPYMAPEQFEGAKDVDARGDVFAAGMLLRRLLTGRLDMEPDDHRAVFGFYTGHTALPPLGSLVPGLSAALCALIDRAVSLDPRVRPADAGALKQAFEAAVVRPAPRPAPAPPPARPPAELKAILVRGGSPSAADRLMAGRLAHAAVRGMLRGRTDEMVGWHVLYRQDNPVPTVFDLDPFITFWPLADVLEETARIVDGTSEVVQWRVKVLREAEPILAA